jgi:hypothetical protein
MSFADARKCGAKKRDGSKCPQPAMPNGRCRIHGGKTPTGIASANFKHGRYIKTLPLHLADRYRESLADPDLISLRDEIALLDTRISDVLSRVDTGGSGAMWENLESLLRRYRKAKEEDKPSALADLGFAIQHGTGDYTAWSEIREMIQERRKMAASERGRLVDMQKMMTSEQAMALIAAVVDIVRTCVSDRGALIAFSAGIERIVRAGEGHQYNQASKSPSSSAEANRSSPRRRSS